MPFRPTNYGFLIRHHHNRKTSSCFDLGFLCIALVAATSSVAIAAPPQLFHNEDCTNFFWFGDFADGKAGERVDRYVDVIADAGVTTLLINTNARKTNYKSDVWEAFFDGYDPDGPDDQPFLKSVPKEAAKRYRHGVGNMLRVHKQGVDYPARMIKRARERGISPWITLRMNDCHENNNMEHPFHGTFWKENSEYWRGGSPGYYARCLDYKEQEVRDLYKALIQETLDRYDVDGVELDFMREPFVFRSGEEAKGKPILTEWMREIRKMTEAAAKKKGHPVRLSVRVPSRPETAEGMGLDAVTWAKEGLIDVLVATPRWATLEFAIPIQAWRDRLGNAKVTLLGGIEVRYQPEPGGPASIVSPELAAGAAMAVLAQGADAVYLFNYFQNGHPAWTPDVYQKMLSSMRSLDTLKELPRRVGVTYRDIVAAGESYRNPLPATGKELTFPIILGPPPSGKWTCEVLIDCAFKNPPKVFVNGTACPARKTDASKDKVSNLVYDVPPTALEGKTTHEVKVVGRRGRSDSAEGGDGDGEEVGEKAEVRRQKAEVK